MTNGDTSIPESRTPILRRLPRRPRRTSSTSARPADERSSGPKAVPHFTPAERAARGRAARGELPRSAHARLGAGAGTRRPGRSPRGAGADPAAGARPDPVRAHARVAVRLLPRRRLSDGGRSRGRAADGTARAALRRCASLELRHLRGAGPEARLQHQRLRRDAAGAVRVGREAARREPRGRGPGARLRRCDPPLGRDGDGARIPPGDGALRRDAEHSTSGTRASMSRRSGTGSGQGCPASR